MAISHAIPIDYEFHIRYGATDSVSTPSNNISLTDYGIHPTSLHDFTAKYDEALIPEGHGAADMSDGYLGPSTIPLTGSMYGDDAEDTFTALASRMNLMAVSTPQSYLLASLYNGSSKIAFRRYGKILGATAAYARKSGFQIIHQFDAEFRVLDPFWYWNTARTQNISCTGTSTVQGTTDTGIGRSKRLTIMILRTGAGVPTNPTVTNNSGQSFQLTGTLATIGDFWLVDMFTGKVTKSVSSVVSVDRANMTGQFWGIKNGADSITVTNGVSAVYTVILTWLERRM